MAALVEGVVQLEVGAEACANILTEGAEDWLPQFILFQSGEVDLLRMLFISLAFSTWAPALWLDAKVGSVFYDIKSC